MDIMRHKDAVDDVVKTGKCIMSSKSPKEKEILKVGIIFNIRQTFITDKCICETKPFGSLSGKDSDSLGRVRRCQSAELRALSAAGTSSFAGLSVLGDL